MQEESNWYPRAKTTLEELWKEEGAEVFRVPVDPVAFDLPDYHMLIKKPMDFGTIKGKLENQSYQNPEEFSSDVELVFENCRKYNSPDTKLYQLAERLEQRFQALWGQNEAVDV
eukprot:TRINITY_DN6089_c0_g1_i10.p1 TRINITY_DN6089_c0_g1~~TRINITY_DN6089_c0_g1_i10.p1  ORF type:complete len:114 (+),score=20.58 TRINITY_DN6089_c0_g1_i10:38-379(+)